MFTDTQSLVVEIDGTPVNYDVKQLAALQLAYAVSIHKSQGSEFPAVVIPLLGEHHVMLRRNLFIRLRIEEMTLVRLTMLAWSVSRRRSRKR